MKKILLLLIVMIFVLACSPDNQELSEEQNIWQEPRAISLNSVDGPFEIKLYPNNQTNQTVILNELSDNYRDKNVILVTDITDNMIVSLDNFLQRNNLERVN